MKEFGNIENQEQRKPKMRLRFFRHGEKEVDDAKPDADIALTKTGRRQAIEKSKKHGAENIGQSVAYGSPRIRTHETAIYVMAGKEEEITGEETLEELKKKIEEISKRRPENCPNPAVKIDERLNFNFDGEFGKIAYEQSKKDYLKFLVEESDELAKKLKSENALTYSKMASNIAGIIYKYLNIAPKWTDLVKNNNKFSETLERFFCTHQGISESFLAKIIEKSKGVKERDLFVQALDNYGFGFTEGFDVEILSRNSNDFIIHISYKKEKEGKNVFEFDEDVPIEMIEDIIKMS